MYMYIYIYTICYTSYNLVYTPINYSYIYHILSFLWELYIYMRLAMNRIHHLQRRDFWISPRTDLFGHVASPDCSRDIDLMVVWMRTDPWEKQKERLEMGFSELFLSVLIIGTIRVYAIVKTHVLGLIPDSVQCQSIVHWRFGVVVFSTQWEFQDPRMEVLYHITPYFVAIFPYIGLKNRPYIW